MYSFSLVVMIACAVFFYKAGEADYSSGIFPAVVSVLFWLGTAYFLHWGLLGCLFGQAVLCGLMVLYNGLVNKRR